MPPIERTPCPHCARPMSFEYGVEEATCQLWRVLSEGTGQLTARIVADCFGRTSRRINDLNAQVTELTTAAKTARRALARHHAAQHPAEFPDDARIE